MRLPSSPLLKVLITAVLGWFGPTALLAQPFQLQTTTLNLALTPGYETLPVKIAVQPTGTGFNYAALTVSSDAAWMTPGVDTATGVITLTFQTSTLSSPSYAGTVTVKSGSDTRSLAVNATRTALNIFKIIDDPTRSRAYATHQNGVNQGAVVILDPSTGTRLGSVTVGKKPCGLAISNDEEELFIINSVDKTISVINLTSLMVTETITLNSFGNWGNAETTADIATGAGSIIYYTDGSWAPTMHVYNRATGTVIQSIIDVANYGYGGFALTSNKQQLFAWAQYGWSAGWAGSYITKYSVSATDGKLTFLNQTSGTYPTVLARDPLETPVLIPASNDKVFVKQHLVDAAAITKVLNSFPGEVYSISPGGEVAATSSNIYEVETGNRLASLPISSTVQAVTSDYSRLMYFNSSTRSIDLLDLPGTVGYDVLHLVLKPGEGEVTLSPGRLEWAPVAGADSYNVYLDTSLTTVTGATTLSPAFKGQSSLPSFALTSTLTSGTTYYWRADSVKNGMVTLGTVHSFTVSPVSSSLSKIDAATFQGHSNYRVPVSLQTSNGSTAWSASADKPWVTFAETTGTAPGTMTVILNTSALAPGTYTAMITVSGDSGRLFTLPVKLKVEPLIITIIKSDPASSKVYAISEDSSVPGAAAYLLEIDSTTETIDRVVPVGASVTDVAIHNLDQRIYVTNWRGGSLLALNKTTLELERTYAFSGFQGTGYGQNDVYRISPAGAGRLIVEEQDQWIDITTFDTVTGLKTGTTFEREGGGATDPTGRYYYHGDNNSSGAELHKFDTNGNTFTELAHKRVQNYSYYGSRVVVVSESGNGVFWNGSYFDAALNELWTIGYEVYSTTPDSRYAFSQSAIYDTQSRAAVLGMPSSTRVSAYNSTSHKLVAPNGAGLGFYTLESPLALPAPVLSSSARTDTTITLNWTDRSLEQNFTLQKRLAGTSAWSNVNQPGLNEVTYTVTGLTSSTAYEFRLRANAVNLTSEWSNEVNVSTMAPPPPAPYIFSPDVSALRVILRWSNSGPGVSYVVERSLGGTNVWQHLATVPADIQTYTDRTAVQEAGYNYRVKAFRNGASSNFSTSAWVLIPLLQAPPAPSWLSLRILSVSAVRLSWPDTKDVMSYQLERQADGRGPWTVLTTLPADAITFTDSSISENTTYQYRLKAANTAGSSPYALSSSVRPSIYQTVFEEDYEPARNDLQWQATPSGSPAGVVQGGALVFDYGSNQVTATVPLNVARGGLVSCDLMVQYGTVYLEYSHDGTRWQVLASADTSSSLRALDVELPAEALSTHMQLRWRTYGLGMWTLDNIQVRTPQPGALEIVEQPATQIVLLGRRVIMEAKALSALPLSYQWYRGGKVLPAARGPRLEIPLVTDVHAGEYYCRVKDSMTTRDSLRATLLVIDRPLSNPVYAVNQGDPFLFVAPVYPLDLASSGAISFTWKRTPVPFDDLNRFSFDSIHDMWLFCGLASALETGSYECEISYQGVTATTGPFDLYVRTIPVIAEQEELSCTVGSVIDRWIQIQGEVTRLKVTGLPPGVRFDSTSRSVVGSPTKAGVYTVFITAANQAGAATKFFNLQVAELPEPLRGSFAGVIERDQVIDQSYGGRVTITVTSTGSYTATLSLGAQTHRLGGRIQVSADGQSATLHNRIAPKGRPAITLSLVLTDSAPVIGQVFTDDSDVAEVYTYRNPWAALRNAPAGQCNIALTPSEEILTSSGYPHGAGYATVTVSPLGVVSIAGKLADGTSLSGASIYGAAAEVPWFAMVNANRGSVLGIPLCDMNGARGEIDWLHNLEPAKSSVRTYAGGFGVHSLEVSGGRYQKPSIGQHIMAALAPPPSLAYLEFSGEPLASAYTQSFTFNTNQTVTVPGAGTGNPKSLRLQFNATTGQYSGTFIENGLTGTYGGILLPSIGEGRGYFLLPASNSAGSPVLSGPMKLYAEAGSQ